MGKIYVITDTHFNHQKIIEYGRPPDFEDRIFEGLKILKPDDMLIHLGDFCIGKDEECHKKFMDAVPCKKILVLGNHDKKSYNWYMEHGWDFVCEMFYLKKFGEHILFSHTPKSKRSINFWSMNVHGHLHDNLHRFPEYIKILTPKHYLLSMEKTDYKPVELESFIKKKSIVETDLLSTL
jgi:calcineurin-like phosphoesterase family protein